MPLIHLVRHAEKASDPDILTSRSPNVPLTDIGRQQAERLATALKTLPIVALLCSPLERAIETAKPLAGLTGLRIESDEAFNEMEFGEWTNRRASELESLPEWRNFNAHRDRATARPPGGESMRDVRQRFVAGMQALRARMSKGEIVIISHEDPIKAALLHFLNTSINEWWRLTIAPASISTVEFDGSAARVVRINHELGFARE